MEKHFEALTATGGLTVHTLSPRKVGTPTERPFACQISISNGDDTVLITDDRSVGSRAAGGAYRRRKGSLMTQRLQNILRDPTVSSSQPISADLNILWNGNGYGESQAIARLNAICTLYRDFGSAIKDYLLTLAWIEPDAASDLQASLPQALKEAKTLSTDLGTTPPVVEGRSPVLRPRFSSIQFEADRWTLVSPDGEDVDDHKHDPTDVFRRQCWFRDVSSSDDSLDPSVFESVEDDSQPEDDDSALRHQYQTLTHHLRVCERHSGLFIRQEGQPYGDAFVSLLIVPRSPTVVSDRQGPTLFLCRHQTMVQAEVRNLHSLATELHRSACSQRNQFATFLPLQPQTRLRLNKSLLSDVNLLSSVCLGCEQTKCQDNMLPSIFHTTEPNQADQWLSKRLPNESKAATVDNTDVVFVVQCQADEDNVVVSLSAVFLSDTRIDTCVLRTKKTGSFPPMWLLRFLHSSSVLKFSFGYQTNRALWNKHFPTPDSSSSTKKTKPVSSLVLIDVGIVLEAFGLSRWTTLSVAAHYFLGCHISTAPIATSPPSPALAETTDLSPPLSLHEKVALDAWQASHLLRSVGLSVLV